MIFFSSKKLFRVKRVRFFLCPVLIPCLTFLLLPVSSFAQNVSSGYTVQHWSIEDGLPVNQINGIWKTTDGYLWLRTTEGLVRFDGKTFTNYTSSTNAALSSSVFLSKSEKGIDQFWFNNGTREELRLIRYKNGEFRHFPFHEEESGVPRYPYDMDSNGVLWVAGKKGLYVFEDEAFSRVFADEINQEVLGVRVFDKVILVATEPGFYLIEGGSLSFIEHNNQRLDHILYEEPGTIWLNQSDSLISISGNQKSTFPAPNTREFIPGFYRTLTIDSSDPDQLILSSEKANFILKNGIFEEVHFLDNVQQAEIPFLTEIKRKTQQGWLRTGSTLWYNNRLVTSTLEPEVHLPKNISMFVDSYGSAWVGTVSGLYKYTKSPFTSYNESNGIYNVYPLLQDHEGSIWTAARNGVVSRIMSDRIETITEENDKLLVLSFYQGPNQDIWLGTTGGIQKWNPKTAALDSIDSPFDGNGAGVRVLQEGEPGILYAGTGRGLYEYHIKRDEWKVIPEKDGEALRITQMYQTNDGAIWAGTHANGLFTLLEDTLHAFAGNPLLSDVNVRSIFSDKLGVLWVGFEGGGLNRIELANDGTSPVSVTEYSRDNGLFGSVIHAILEDDYERLWMSSNQGIFWVYKEQLNQFAEGKLDNITPIIYQEADGLPGNEANGGAQSPGLIARDGSLWFAMLDGITNVHPDDIQKSSLSFPTKIETIAFADSEQITGTREVALPKKIRAIDIHYTAFNYEVKAENIHFSYILEGFHDDWVYAGTERTASFTNLPAGDYTFKVKAGLGGQWNEEHVQSVNIFVEPFFYETAWFFWLAIFTGSSVFIALVIWGNRKLNLQKKQYDLEVQEQENALSENEQFLLQLQAYVEERIHQSSITASETSLAMNVSERQLYRIIKKSTGLTPLQFVREIRLKKAHQILESQQATTVAEVAHSVGFSNPFYFTKIFKTRFDVQPSEMIKQNLS